MNRNTILVLLLIPTLGCLNQPNMRTASSMTLDDLGYHQSIPMENIHYLDETPTEDRFPSGIVITRLCKETVPQEETEKQLLRMFPLRGYEATFWSELFDGTTEVREVILLHPNSTRDVHVTLTEILQAARVQDATLLLVYGYDNEQVDYACRVSGLVLDIRTGERVALVQYALSQEEAMQMKDELPVQELPEADSDHMKFYTDYLAFRGFEKTLKECIWGLIDRDRESGKLQPNPFGSRDDAASQSAPDTPKP